MADVPLAKSPLPLAELQGADTATDGQVPTADGAGGVAWETPAAGGGGGTTFAGCRVTKSADQNLTSSTFTPVTWDTESFDTDGFHSTASNTSRFTVPTGMGGYYRLSGSISSQSMSDQNNAIARLTVNGVADDSTRVRLAASGSGTGNIVGLPFSWVVNLAAGDYVEVEGYSAAGTAIIDSIGSTVTFEFIGT